jgi:hypothetical protein
MGQRINVWLALRQAAHDKVRDELMLRRTSDVERESNIPEWVWRFFEMGIHDWRTARTMWRMDTVWFEQGAVFRRWHLWNLTFKTDIPTVRRAVEKLLETYPDQVKIVGAWNKNGDLLVAPDARIAEFCPNAELRDHNLMLGQSPRKWVQS